MNIAISDQVRNSSVLRFFLLRRFLRAQLHPNAPETAPLTYPSLPSSLSPPPPPNPLITRRKFMSAYDSNDAAILPFSDAYVSVNGTYRLV